MKNVEIGQNDTLSIRAYNKIENEEDEPGMQSVSSHYMEVTNKKLWCNS